MQVPLPDPRTPARRSASSAHGGGRTLHTHSAMEAGWSGYLVFGKRCNDQILFPRLLESSDLAILGGGGLHGGINVFGILAILGAALFLGAPSTFRPLRL